MSNDILEVCAFTGQVTTETEGGFATELFVGKPLYARNGDKVVITALSGDALTVAYQQKHYARSVSDIGKTLFTSNPLEEAAAEEYEGDPAFEQETRHLRDTQKELETFSGFLLNVRIGMSGFVVGTETGFDEVTKEELIASPYFARMDIEIGDKRDSSLEVAYIGKKGVYHDDRLLVSDWRSEVGQKYYMKNMTRFAYNDLDYELLLRRALRIKNSVLTGYQDEFARAAYLKSLTNGESDADIQLERITDPFLQDIIRQKHYQNKLTDIVESIQENQNAIITHDENDSVVVQGCAGSGKTMILLHRLSFIKFRNRSLDLTKIKILTPNRLFSLYINDLSKTLELENVERLTVSEYYAELLTRYYNAERVQLGRKCAPNELLDYKTALLYKEAAAVGWPPLYSDALREFIKKESVQFLRHICENRIKYREICAVLKDRLNITLDDVLDTRNISNLRNVLKNIKSSFVPYYKQQAACKKSEAELAAAELKFLGMKSGLPNAGALLDEIIREKLLKTPNLREKYERRKKALQDLKKYSPENTPAENTAVEQELLECDFSLCAVMLDRVKHIFEVDKKRLQQEKEKIPFSEQEMGLIESAYRHADEFSVSLIENTVIDTLERENAVSLSFKNKLYAKLLICYVILGKLPNGEKMLCVDEGHDLYAGEYRLFYLVNGSNLRFNIYGDINQILSDGEGIADWDNLYSIFDFRLFTLNENYRNSSEIIEYSNSTLGLEATNLGIGGEPVGTLTFQSFVEHVNNNIIGTRKFAIIVKKKTRGLVTALRGNIGEKISCDTINAGEIALLTPQEAKGLEFDTCYVMTQGMNRNERYISFTRALNELYIIPSAR